MLGASSVLAVITARGGSKGIPGKNIISAGGRPLIQWTIDAARQSRHIDRLVLSSDDEEIIKVAEQCGCEVPFRRDPSLARDETTSMDVVVDALKRLPGYDIVLLLQPTSPLRSTADIDGALTMLVTSDAPACVSVRAADEHPYWTFKMDASGKLSYFAEPPEGIALRRQSLPKAWCLNGAIYAAKTAWLLKAGSFLTPETVGFPMPAERSLDIDTYDDLAEFERILDRRLKE